MSSMRTAHLCAGQSNRSHVQAAEGQWESCQLIELRSCAMLVQAGAGLQSFMSRVIWPCQGSFSRQLMIEGIADKSCNVGQDNASDLANHLMYGHAAE